MLEFVLKSSWDLSEIYDFGMSYGNSKFETCLKPVANPELHAGRAGPRVRAEYYYQPAGFAGLRPASSPQQARTISDSTEFIIHEWKIFTRY